MRDSVYCEWQHAKKISLLHNPIHVSHKNTKALFQVFRRADEEYEEMKYEEHFYDKAICDIQVKIYEIKKQQRRTCKNIKKNGKTTCEKKQ
tara:strand:- start:1211 stop:1483 length:273 start_codon:yes stop_codon:yes gene_type:complete